MIEQDAIVTHYTNGRAWIRAQSGGACGGCQQQAHCGTATLAKGLPQREFELDCPVSVQPGEQVRVSIDDSALLSASLLAYLLPMIVMLAMVVGCNVLLPQLTDALPIVALAGLLLGCWLAHVWQSKCRSQQRFQPHIVGKFGRPE